MPAFTDEQKAFIREVTYEVLEMAGPKLIRQHAADCKIERTAEATSEKRKFGGRFIAIAGVLIALGALAVAALAFAHGVP